jgi:hypothetical protein
MPIDVISQHQLNDEIIHGQDVETRLLQSKV